LQRDRFAALLPSQPIKQSRAVAKNLTDGFEDDAIHEKQ
jgi:hypothetical protein